MPRVHYSSLAAEDLLENAEYIARDKPDAAYRWVEKIEATCELLAADPEVGQQRQTRRCYVLRDVAAVLQSEATLRTRRPLPRDHLALPNSFTFVGSFFQP